MAGALEAVRAALRQRAGALFASGYEYPGRYNRWDIGFAEPPLELVARGRAFSFRARSEAGEVLLEIFRGWLAGHPHLDDLQPSPRELAGRLRPMDRFFPEEERSRQPSVFSVLRAVLQGLRHPEEDTLGFYGAFGYDLVFQFEPVRLKRERGAALDAWLFFPDRFTLVDRRLERAFEVSYEFSKGGRGTRGLARASAPCSTLHPKSAPGVADHRGQEYAAKVRTVQEGCKRGDYFEVVLSQTFNLPFQGDAFDVFDRIQRTNPSPYEFLINLGGEQLTGASPEMFVRVEGRRVETCPISGTVARGSGPMEDADRIVELLSSTKEEAELTMCTDVDRNDKSRVCVPGSVKVLGRRLIEMYSRVIHTVDHVEGQLREDRDGLDAFLAHMWACTLTGSPKAAAMQAIEDLENSPRGWYGGAVGAIKCNGDINTGITIRTVRLKDGVASVRVGATLLAMSDPDREQRETELKAEAFLRAVTGEAIAAPPAAAETLREGQGRRVLFVDHQDSFVHTLAGYVRFTGAEVLTVRSGFPEDEIFASFRPDLVFLSPGPFTPGHFGLPDLIRRVKARGLPIFGVCLGLQGMVEAEGGVLGVLETPQHGVRADIRHDGRGIFEGLPNPFLASRYHSLYAIEAKLPACFEVAARSADNVIMAVRHRSYPMAGVQFHPESIHALRGAVGLMLVQRVMKLLR